MTKESYNFGVDTEARLYTETSGMTAKRFQWVFIKDNELELRDNGIVKKFNNERLEELLNELHEENQRLTKVIEQDEKLIQSTYDELTKLRCIKKNLGRIKSQWDWIMEVIQYD